MVDKNKIFGYVCMGCGLLLVLSVFLPYVSVYSVTKSLWSSESSSRIIYILCGIGVLALYVLNKKTEISYLLAGHILLSAIETVIANEGLEYLSVAFYFLLLASCAIIVCTYLYDESKGTALINLSANRMPNMTYNPNDNFNQNMNYNSNNNFNQNNGFNPNNNFNQNNDFNSNNNFNQMNQPMMNNQNSNMFIPNDNSSNNNFN